MEEYVWVLPQNGSSDVPIGACVLARLGNRIKIKDDNQNEYWVSQEEILRPMHPTSIVGVEDMISLGELQECSILRNLEIRYTKDLIYTYIGSILIVVNPYKPLPINGKDKMVQYRKKRLGDLPPHIFAVADHSYESMRKKSEKRCLIISGESGAGKTESTKLFLRYLAAISHKLSGKEQQILDSNPILEAFGNAKTVCNCNSSRFGKYISVAFNTDGSIQSAKIKQYLLEKSRIVSQNQGEQNYHIFYSLLSGLTAVEKQRLRLTTVSSYNYLNRGLSKNHPNSEENQFYTIEVIKSAMRVLNFSDAEIWSIFEVIAAILHFGNIEFESVSISNTEVVNSITREEIENICSLLQVSEKPLVDSLTKKTISTHGDNVVKFLSKQEAINSRDGFVKSIFGNLFNFIVEKINSVLATEGKASKCHIGILDIFGFEAFDRNSFEQLCINYANEKFQQFFIGHVFKAEQDQYAIEEISWDFVEYPDNTEILKLIEDGPKSILSIINDSTKIPRGSDESMLNKIIGFHCENPFFLKPKYRTMPAFGIQHFAGVVLYDTKEFVEKNHDTCSSDIKQVVQSSKNNFIKNIVSYSETDSNVHYRKRMETLLSKFKNSLDLLMSELNESQPFFIRCIKPNEVKKPQKFDRMLCRKQLKYSGMTEVTKIREAGYPVRYDFFQFVQHYRMLVPGIPLAHKTPCRDATLRISHEVFRNFPKPDYRLGRTKIFLKHAEGLFLEAERERVLYSYAVVVQKIVRGWMARRRFIKLKKAVVVAENCWLGKQQRHRGNKIRWGFQRLLSKLKSRHLTSEFQQYRQLIVRLQALCKGFLIRSLLKGKLEKIGFHQLEDAQAEPIDFKGFVKLYFQDKQHHRFSKEPIKTSLTRLVQAEDIIAAKAIWLTILRYTADGSDNNFAKTSGSAQLREILKTISTFKSNAESKSQNDSERVEITRKVNRLYDDWLKTNATQIQNLCFVIGHGIWRPELRDEIYCQICKVVTKNPSKKATQRGWDLLSSCTGCFPPSDVFLKYLKTFIRQGDKKSTSFLLFRLHRTIQNGSRSQPPFTTELEAIKQQKPINLDVFLSNGARTCVKVDSATTANELLNLVAKNIKLTDVLGFSLMLGRETRRLSLGDGSLFVLDAVSEYEQYVAEVGGSFENMQWKLHLRKEMFAPWYAFTEDETAINLAYHQIKEGVITGEYIPHETDLLSLIAQICYADKGKLQPPALNKAIGNYVPKYISIYISDDFDFKEQVLFTYEMMFDGNERPVKSVRSEIVKYAASTWTSEFSRIFTVVGSIKNLKSIAPYHEVLLLVGINSSGIFFTDESNGKHVVAKMDFADIREVSRREATEGQGYILRITNYEALEISLHFQSNFDTDFHKLLITITETIKKYSKFVMCMKNYEIQDESFLELRTGDFITLSDKFYGRDLLRNTWAEGFNSRSGKTGNFLLECVEIIPTMRKPSELVLAGIRNAVLHGNRIPFYQNPERLKHYSLESYADKFFRARDFKRNEDTGQASQLWKYSTENLRKPLHARLVNRDNEAKLAVEAFGAILRFTENQKGNDEGELVSTIFRPGLENDHLRDEIYCQLMKQLTCNTNKDSEDKTWQLMWLVTGLFPCGEILAAHVKKFLQSRRTIQIARDCMTRFNEIMNSNPRKYTSHVIEIEASKKQPSHILHKVYFPDDTHKFLQVNSLTTVKQLKEDIFTRLGMNLSGRGFCLLLQFSERLFSLPDDFYLFDFLQIVQKWMKRNKMSKEQYKICFMKSTWKNSVPSYDKITDSKFLFPQMYKMYIYGYYEIPEQDIIQLAALLYKVFFSNETTQQFQKVLEKLIPSKAASLIKADIWEKEIKASCSKHITSTEEDCKIKFLKYLSRFTSHSLPYFVTLEHSLNLTNYVLFPITLNSHVNM